MTVLQKGTIVKTVSIITYVIYLFHFVNICNDGTEGNGGYHGWQIRWIKAMASNIEFSPGNTWSKNTPVLLSSGFDKAVKNNSFTKCDPKYMCFLNILCDKIGSTHNALPLPTQSSDSCLKDKPLCDNLSYKLNWTHFFMDYYTSFYLKEWLTDELWHLVDRLSKSEYHTKETNWLLQLMTVLPLTYLQEKSVELSLWFHIHSPLPHTHPFFSQEVSFFAPD